MDEQTKSELWQKVKTGKKEEIYHLILNLCEEQDKQLAALSPNRIKAFEFEVISHEPLSVIKECMDNLISKHGQTINTLKTNQKKEEIFRSYFG